MATKLQLITELAERTTLTVRKNPLNWTSFLQTAAWNYKYPFQDQLLIYAQRPDATACASIEVWNEKLGRWVNKGAKGIALIQDSGGRLNLRHVFDVTDTNSRYNRPVALWKMKDGYAKDVTETLDNAFGGLEEKQELEDALISAARNAVEDNFPDYLSELMDCRENSFLEELNVQNVEVIFKDALKNSVAYMLLIRCGCNAGKYLSLEDFQSVLNFNTLDTVSCLGAAASDISEMLLREIRETVKELQNEEKNPSRTFAKIQDAGDNETIKQSHERDGEDGNDLHAGGRLPDSRPDAAGGSDADRKVWDAAPNISEKTQERDVRQPDAVEQAEQPFGGDRPDSEGARRTDHGQALAEQSGTGQSNRPAGLDGVPEQSAAFGGGNGTGGDHLQLSIFPTVEQQIEAIENAEDEKSSAFSISQEEIDHVLCKGTGFQNGKFRVYLHYQEQHTPKETIAFLKQEYGIGGGTYYFLDGTQGNDWHDSKGISLSKSGSFITDPELRLSWNQVAKRLGDLIAVGRYLNGREREHLEREYLPIYEQMAKVHRQQLAEQAYAKEILNREPAPSKKEETPARDTTNYAFSPDDTVYLGADEYEIFSIEGGKVMLRDINFPLFSRELDRDELEKMLRENPLNDHLLVIGEETEQTAEQNAEKTENQPAEKEMAVGTELAIEDRHYEIDAINQESGTVSLRDITFQGSTGFPIFRRESVAFVRSVLEESNQAVRQKTEIGEAVNAVTDHEPKKPVQPRVNFRITDDNLGAGGQKAKYGWNAAAIRLLNRLEEQERLATPEEQESLSRYVGWGGLPQVFDEKNSQWDKEYTELKELLTDEEYTSARASTLNAYYTSPTVIKAIYSCLENMGFKTGNILEPACGVGNFFGLVPDSMKNSKLYGIELDGITGRIAKQLYQNASIAVQGYEETSLPDSFFDLAVGNVPFGSYGVADKKYDKYKFYIHDYFFAKTLDKVRPGGIIAFITSKGTMDKQNSEVRKYIAQRAELLGAVRLPNNAFLANAGTEVTADILFLQKRDRVIDIEPDWVHLSATGDGIPVNRYFTDNPDMVLGTMACDERMYGNKSETTCIPYENADLALLLREALENIHAEITEYEMDELSDDADTSIPADPNVRNFSFCMVDGGIYYRENSRMNRVETSVTAQGRIKGMIAIRDCVRDLIEYQIEDYSDETIQGQQRKLNRLYEAFVTKYGLLNSRGNDLAFSDDSSYCLLCSLEVIDENGELEHKADMFTKRTIKQRSIVTHVDTAAEALAISIAEKACVDMGFMQSLTGLSEEKLVKDLEGVIFSNPTHADADGVIRYETADAYLSGNVREKLKTARQFAEMHPNFYSVNVTALEAVQPKDLGASEIDVRLGATWLPSEVVKDFIFELLETAYMYRRYIDVLYSNYTANWNVKGKNDDRSDNIKANVTYGTKRINAYKIIEETLNLRDVRIFDNVYEDGVEKRVLNKKETAIAQQKQEAIKEAFQNWIWKDPQRREVLTRLYNDRFNSIRPREYDGSHIRFTGMNPEISLRKHQVDAVAHILYGGNTLLAHCVGAGKTYEMTAAAMESKHLGLCNKSLFVVPNHLTEQWAGEFLQLYPSANILVATKKDFETQNRKKFCARIATGDYDAVIIGHSQFEKIPISQERQKRQLEEQISEITSGIQELKEERGERYAIKQLEKTKKTLKLKLDKLNDTSRKDDVVTFEELGVDRLFIDEADFYKNLFLYTKMRNVAGLSQTEAQKSSDLFAKCRYLDELTEERGVIFATGTPISNSITEMYTMQRYLQYNVLRQKGLQHFDCWASTFGETVTAIELAPEGTGYRAKTRFARFYNLPELMNMFKEVADIKTADMLNLPVPKANYSNVAVKPSEFQQDMVSELAERAERVRNRMVEPNEDNMLKITNDGRKLALDQRLANPLLPDNEDSKVNACVENVYRFWQENRDKQLTQLVFCDLSTPKGDGNFNVYEDVRQKLAARGVTGEEVQFIHDANTETKKKELFTKVRKGQVRILLGSTFKMGAGTNVQDKLIALHDLDCPWRPRDLEQRSGRIVRQGNKNGEVHIFRYVTENTFDAYLYQILENKQRFISQIMTSKSPVRSAEDIDETALSYAEVKALATGNPYIREKMDLDIQVSKLKLIKANHLSQRYALEDRLLKHYPQQIKFTEERITGYEKDLAQFEQYSVLEPAGEGEDEAKFAGMTIKGIRYTEKAKAGSAILEVCKLMTTPEPQELGSYMGFPMLFSFDGFSKQYQITLRGALSHPVTLGTDIHGNIARLNNVLAEMPKKLEYCREQLKTLRQQVETAKEQIDIPFEKEQELQTKSARLAELNILLNMDKRENEVLDDEPDEESELPEKKAVGYER
ncbi:DEAD/DEAH box helicase family protein [Dehalobacter sp. TeCB1]|uniref:DEAD/DEAH box helicase family protein n=1 Tax=Dehalobacter sp. TeCB1 TaxID=1843715 RepID=UPI00083A8F2E|nr:DEAD/DEAH box helicase family protein [Dehalobacter sp. TeCB1]OCZ49925.1 helicase [Dehalobacter sp. TeCB1]